MDITKTIGQEYTQIHIDGDVDASSAIELDEALEQLLDDGVNALIDCTKLKYISSAGLGVFMSYLSDFENKDLVIVLHNLSDNVYKVFELIGLSQLLNIVDNTGQAIEVIEKVNEKSSKEYN